MSIKKLIAYITIIAILALSCNVTVLAAEKPTAKVGATLCSGTTLTGSYTYTGSQPQGESIFRWYISDDFFDKGTLVEGANELTFNVSKATVGKFITFAVVPVDSSGTEGDEVCADPIMQNQGYYEDFASGMPENVTSVVTADGHVQVADDPAGGDDKVLSVMKEHDSSYKTEARVKFDSVTASESVVDVYLYVTGIEGLVRIFGVYNDTYGSVFEIHTDAQGKLYYRGGNGMQESSLSFPADTWNHVTLEIDGNKKTVKATVNGSNIITGSDTESWRFMNDGYDNVAVYFRNYGNGGNVYIKNLSVMNVMGQEAAEADAAALEDVIPYETIRAITLPSTGENGSNIFWSSNKPQYIANDGAVSRPAYGDGDAEVILTAYVMNGSALVKKDLIVTVLEATLPPIAEDVIITQNASRYVTASYTFYDEDNDDESGSVYQWYVEENGEYKPVENANELIFVPTKDFDGKNIKFSVTPKNASDVVGEETFSEPFRYVYYETQKPIAQITDKSVNTDGAFEFTYTYTSADYIEEGNTVITWYMSDTLFGEYTPVSGATDTVYKPEKLDAYYKFSIVPTDSDGNMGDEVTVGPFMYAPSGTNGASVAEGALSALVLPEETMLDLELPMVTDNGAYYTWVSSDEAVIAPDGKITRPSKDEENASATLTVYAVCGFETRSSEFTVIVNKLTDAPVVSEQKLSQVSRPIELSYVFADADENAEGDTKYEWYYKPDADSEFVLIEGAADSRYAPSKDMDGYIFIAKITPMDDTFTVGEQVTTPEYTYVYQSPAKPTVQMNKTIYDATALIGDYVYENADGIPEGESEYAWYSADKLFGNYKQIYGETGKSLAYDGSYDGKYVKFTVTPKDIEGIAGDTVEANPVLISFNAPETFEEDFDIAKNINTSNLVGGTVKVVQDPADPTNTALRLQRTSTNNNEMSRIGYKVPQYTDATGLIIEADLYASSDMNGTWEMFYICDTNTSQAYKLWHSGKNLASRGGSYTKPDGTFVTDSSMTLSTEFTKDTWHHVKIVLDTKAQMMLECSFNGEVLQTDMPFRFSVPVVGEILSYIQNGYSGTGYMDNIQITPVLDYTDKAKEDAAAIDLGADLNAVIANLRLPVTGSVNGSAITWTSSDESVISTRGKVNRPASEEGDKQVTLTAHVITGNDYYTKDFNINVMRILTDEEIVEYDAEKLADYNGIITDKDLSLLTEGIYGADYTWVSSDESVITNDGKVTLQDEKKDVTFNVTVTCGDFSETKQVTVTIAPVLSDNLIINGGIDASSAKAQYPALNAGDGDYTTSWSSLPVDTAPAVILDMGKTKNVNQLYIADSAKSIKSLKLSASRDKATWSDVNITSSSMGSNINLVEFDKISTRYIRVSFTSGTTVSANEIRLMYVPVDSDKVASGINDITLPVDESVTSDFEVITELADGTKVVWTSSNTDVISINGSTAEVDRASSDKTVTLTATVTSGGVSAEKVFVVVVEGKSSDSSGGGGGGGGGGSSSGGRTNGGVTSAAGSAAAVVAPVVQSSTFADIASVPWAIEAINSLASIGVVNGTSATTFEPSRSITREEFAAILYRGFGFDKVTVNGSFSDVDASDWYYEPVMQLSSLGIINGVGDGSFGTGRTITRQDMAVMIHRAALAVNAQFAEGGISFADSDSIAAYAKTAVDALSGAQIINGVGNDMFNPLGNATRAEATVILSRIMNYIK